MHYTVYANNAWCAAPDVDIAVMRNLLSANSKMAGMKDDFGCLPMHYVSVGL
jgi:hypothetical protein